MIDIPNKEKASQELRDMLSEGVSEHILMDVLTTKHNLLQSEVVRLMEEENVQDDRIVSSLVSLPLWDIIFALREAGWSPERIYSSLKAVWSFDNDILIITTMRTLLETRWKHLLDISGVSPEELSEYFRENSKKHDVSVRFFVRVWPDPDHDIRDFEEGEIRVLSDAEPMARALFDDLSRKIGHRFSGGLKRCFWHIRYVFEDALGEERVPGSTNEISL